MGFFSGEAARDYFDGLIRRQCGKQGEILSKNAPSLPFIMHKQIFKRDLLICGANLSTGKTELFSWRHTPHFPVADAVRISMSLPIIYKPYVIKKKIPGWPPCGTYIDGGIWNNLPFREIAAFATSSDSNTSESNPKTTPASAPLSVAKKATPAADNSRPVPTPLKVVTENRQTLGLRLEISPPQEVLTGGELVAKIMGAGLTAGESQVITDIEPFTVLLDTEGLDLFKFEVPEPFIKNKVDKRSRRTMYRYFGEKVPDTDLDFADDFRIDEARSKGVCK
jgi:hypothetical protein